MARRLVLVVELDQRELAVRLLEAWTGQRRPAGLTATEALDISPIAAEDALKMAMAAMEYFREVTQASRQEQ